MAEKLDLGNLTDQELGTELETVENHYHSLKFKHAVSELANTSEIKKVRRNVARIKTEIRARELKNSEAPRDRIRARRRRNKSKK